jgi:hypothetical protein
MAKKKDASKPTTSPVEFGLAPRLHSAIEIVGRSDQDGFAVTHYGYLTYLHGVPLEEMFLGADARTEANARFTFSGNGEINSRHETGNIITTAAPGRLIIFHNAQPGGDFKDPKSFSRGHPIAEFSIRYHCVLNVDLGNVNVGAISAGIDLSQLSATPFTHDKRQARLGRKGQQYRAAATGEGWLTGRDPFRAYFLYGGHFFGAD